MPYSRPWGVLFSIVKHTSFPISFFRRNSRAGNAQGWKTEPSPSGARLFSHCTINTQATSPLQQPGNKLGPEEKAKMKRTAQLTHLEGSWNEGLIVGATCVSPKDRHHAIPGTSTRTFPTSIAVYSELQLTSYLVTGPGKGSAWQEWFFPITCWRPWHRAEPHIHSGYKYSSHVILRCCAKGWFRLITLGMVQTKGDVSSEEALLKSGVTSTWIYSLDLARCPKFP